MATPRRPSLLPGSLAGGGHGFLQDIETYPCVGHRQRSVRFPLFDPVVRLFWHDRPDHRLTARTADRAVPVRLRRFLAEIHVPSGTFVRQAL